MINNDKIFSSENYNFDNEQSQEGKIFDNVILGLEILFLAFLLFVYVIIPLYKKTPLYKHLLKRKEAKEKELAKQRKNEYKEKRNAEQNAFNQIKNHPEIKRLQTKITEMETVAEKFSKGIVPILQKEISKIDPKHHIKVYDCDDDVDQYTELSSVLWDRCVEIAKAINDKTTVTIRIDRPVFCIDGLKQYTLDPSYGDEDNKKFDEVYQNALQDFCNKMNIYGRSVDSEGTGDETIVFDIDWQGDHHGTVQYLVRWVTLDFSK